jgi:hypothetical protein
MIVLLPTAPTPPRPAGSPPAAPPSAPPRPRAPGPARICTISTKCASRQEFVAAFSPFVDKNTLFIPARVGVEPGQVVRFQFTLSDGTLVYAGRGEVKKVHREATGPLRKSGILLLLQEVDDAFRAVSAELAAYQRNLGERPPGASPAAASGGGSSSDPPRATRPFYALENRLPPPRKPAAPVRPGLPPVSSPSTAAGAQAPGAPAPSAVVSSGHGPQLHGFDEKTPVIFPGAVGADQRTPGSPHRLPANPLSDMSTNALDFFVEATLTEDESAVLGQRPETEATAPDASVPTEGWGMDTGSSARPRAQTDPRARAVGAGTTAPPASAASVPPASQAPAVPGANNPWDRPLPASAGAAPSWAVPEHDAGADREALLFSATGLAALPKLWRPLRAWLAALQRPRLATWARRWGLPAASGIIGLLAGFILWGSEGPAPEPGEPPASEAPAAAAHAVAEAAVPASAAPPANPAEAPPTPTASALAKIAAPPAAAAGTPRGEPSKGSSPPTNADLDRAAPVPASAPEQAARSSAAVPTGAKCIARIESKPSGALVTIGRKPLGRTPISRATVPCGAVDLLLTRPRYKPASERFVATVDSLSTVDARLVRPSAELYLTSVPPGAAFKVNGQGVGRAPRTVSVQRFERIRIEAELPGQKPWQQSVYIKDPTMKLQVNFGGVTPSATPSAGKKSVAARAD